jgi:RNA polymerase-binding transcription factor DksA
MTTIDITDGWLADARDRLARTRDEHTANLLDLTAVTPEPGETDAHAALLAATRQGLADATEALRRIEEGTYGRCEICGATIPLERLEIIPQARTCVSCRH